MQFYPPSIGLDISPSSVKAVSLKKGDGELFDLVAFGREYLPENTIADGEIKNFGAASKVIESILSNEEIIFPKTKYIVASLPEEEAFLRILELPSNLNPQEFAETLKFEVEANIPMPLEEVYYDYEIISNQNAFSHCDVLVNAVSKKIVDSYVNFFGKYDYKPLAFEIESMAAKRALFSCGKEPAKETVLVLDIGAVKTGFMIVSEGVLRFTSSNSIAGDKFSQALSEHFPLNLKEAEFMKRVVGLDSNQEKGKELLEVLRPNLIALKDQIKNYIEFFESHPSKDRLSEEAQKVSKIVITGGGSGLWGLKDWLSREFGMEVILGNSLINIRNSSKNSKIRMSREDSLAYTTAIGLALRNFNT